MECVMIQAMLSRAISGYNYWFLLSVGLAFDGGMGLKQDCIEIIKSQGKVAKLQEAISGEWL